MYNMKIAFSEAFCNFISRKVKRTDLRNHASFDLNECSEYFQMVLKRLSIVYILHILDLLYLPLLQKFVTECVCPLIKWKKKHQHDTCCNFSHV